MTTEPSNFMEQRSLLRNARISLIECLGTDGYRPTSPQYERINEMIKDIEEWLEIK